MYSYVSHFESVRLSQESPARRGCRIHMPENISVGDRQRSDQVSNITVSEKKNPLFHSDSPPLTRGHRWDKV
ncbi:hypothetical protein EYF80_002405 [Liparis tanakae]|uniref:Uncharacterized protein n=1 Tax=Liparis tanakae TaxID=230148 RepID=A0A4Z2JBS1_9TELE|nr:hypothetical protein EYF80_002405 [Liparis tanakae]